MRVAVSFDWRPAGEVRLAAAGPVLPALSDRPGIYRFRFSGHGHDGSYVGAAVQLRKRAYFYAHPARRKPPISA